MKFHYLALIAILFAAFPALANNAYGPDTIESRTAGAQPRGDDASTPAAKPAALATAPTKEAAAPAPTNEPAPNIIWGVMPSTPENDHPEIFSYGLDLGQGEALAPGADKPVAPELAPAPVHAKSGKPVIAIVIDDMGVDRKHSARALKLPPAVTMSYLPYSIDIKGQTDEAKKSGHELLVHMPMQPDRASADPGPNYLGTQMSPLELQERIEKNLSAFTGYVGINNHMGSKFTCDKEGMEIVMTALEQRKLMFLDSRTSPATVAESTARAHHLKTTHRDVFIDNDESAKAVAESLTRIESVAKHAGAAIAIGHPKEVTLDALEKWLPTLKGKGFELVPISDVINLRSAAAAAPAKTAAAPEAKPRTGKTPEIKKAD